MKTTVQTLHHLQGEQAYQIYWQQFYQCRPRLSSVMAIDLNLEIIVDDAGELLAYRYDHPDDMQGLVLNEGQWRYNHEADLTPSKELELQQFFTLLRFNLQTDCSFKSAFFHTFSRPNF